MGRRGDEERYRRMFDAEARHVLAYALRRVSEPQDAADVVAETFTVAWRRRGEVPDGGQARLWLYGVARRVIANEIRGRTRRTRLIERLRGELRDADLHAQSSDPRVERLEEAWAHLSPEDREVLRLSVWEELGPNEIAAVMGCPPATARTRLHRARTRLRAELSEPMLTATEERA